VRSTTLSWPKMTRPTPSRTLEMSASVFSAYAIMSFSPIGLSLIITLMQHRSLWLEVPACSIGAAACRDSASHGASD
jgi:hypothetical protein